MDCHDFGTTCQYRMLEGSWYILSPKLHIIIECASHEADDMPDVWDSGCYYRWLSRLRHSGIPEERVKGATSVQLQSLGTLRSRLFTGCVRVCPGQR